MSNINLDKVVIPDANELAHAFVASLKPEEFPSNFDGKTCVDCGDAIEPQRLASVRTCRCGECQPYHDKEVRAKRLQSNPEFIEE